MKALVPVAILACIMLLFWSCSGQNGSQEANIETEDRAQITQEEPVMYFDTLIHDFGTIIEGERVVCYFDYLNKGGADLVITQVEAGCGCTTPKWSREPLAPGEKETLEVVFDASGRSGEQRKLITVRSNAGNEVVKLTIRARVNNSV